MRCELAGKVKLATPQPNSVLGNERVMGLRVIGKGKVIQVRR
jgi:hypothetical protein